MELHNKTAIVTGSARGIGRAVALRFARAGAAVVLVDTADATETARAVTKAGGTAHALPLDITDHHAVDEAFQHVVDEAGAIDILVNNAGIIARGTIETLTHDQWKTVMEVNVTGTFNCCKAAVRSMIPRRYGRIVNITSIAGKTGDLTAAPVYGTSKGAVNTLTKSLARQLAEYGITVNAVAPHAVETEMSAEWSEEKRRAVIASIPLGRLARPEEVAEAALFLAGDGASFITGEILDLNGGAFID